MGKTEQKFHLHFAFTIHDQVDTVMNFMDRIADADVVCTEMSGWAQADQKILQAVADGRCDIGDALYNLESNGFAHEDNRANVRMLLERVFGTQKLIFFADVPERERRLLEKLGNAGSYLDSIDDLCRHTFEGRFDQAVRECRILLTQFFAVHREREQVILQRLTEDLPRHTRLAPTTAEKAHVNVVISLGMGHSTMLRGFNKADFKLSRSFPRSIQFVDSTTAALRAIRVAGTNEVSEETIARVLLENHVILPSNLWPKISREVTRLVPYTFSLAEIQALFADYSKDPNPKRIKSVTQKTLSDKGIPINQDPVEWIAYLNKLCDQSRLPARFLETLKSPLEKQVTEESVFTSIARRIKRLISGIG